MKYITILQFYKFCQQYGHDKPNFGMTNITIIPIFLDQYLVEYEMLIYPISNNHDHVHGLSKNSIFSNFDKYNKN